ncbi:DNA excision repair protein ERCC-6-like [Athalia rosae]|uniref:DNA excision repair protein ERCC-6-like n=1 Tax=Athalia rosae TaxID=37344 RepID=UPI0020345781|nr:DNA excision repair protein ERCC-6-like [Athalia rosae]
MSRDELNTDNQSDNFKDDSVPARVILMRSQSSIIAEVTRQISKLTKSDEPTSHVSKVEFQTDEAKVARRVQLGEITPFQASAETVRELSAEGTSSKMTQLLDLERYIFRQAELARCKAMLKAQKRCAPASKEKTRIPVKKQKLVARDSEPQSLKKQVKCIERRKKNMKGASNNDQKTALCNDTVKALWSASNKKEKVLVKISDTPEIENVTDDSQRDSDSGSEYLPSDEQPDSADEGKSLMKKRVRGPKVKTGCTKSFFDDGDEWIYRQRVKESGCLKKQELHRVDNLFKVPMSIWKRLYKYQKVSVKWLWELHGRNLGGLLGDEMGLGKTVQLIAFLAGLDCSELLSDGGRFRGLGPSLIVCPATLLEQWVKHFHEWWPTLRVATLHHMGTHRGNPEHLVYSLKCGGILVTSYTGILIHKELLVNTDWHYVILDEGHRIRNPDTKVTKAVKEFSTPHRLILTGSPMQNSLKELWSLFDFILPGKLGTLPAFMEHFAAPITRGGYTNASALQEATALNVAKLLNDSIAPYMIRRTKTDVSHHVRLPEKNEQVLFCSLTEEQRNLYKGYLKSGEVTFILNERNNSSENGRYRARLLVALTALRKICNHPDLYVCDTPMDSDEYHSTEELEVSDVAIESFGYWKRAGKMVVVRSLLKIWKKQGHRVLLFTQSRQMLAILENLIQHQRYSYLRMDGSTPVCQRQQDVQKFNTDLSYFVFILTTRVGGLGINLIGANRVVIYDPDWNPATDAQAKERAWRIGQKKNVTIYRLITAGTIEEKIYHRQIFKQLLANKVLEDPRQRRLFRTSDLTELFALNEPAGNERSESEKLFSQSKLRNFSVEKVKAMRELAANLSRNVGNEVERRNGQMAGDRNITPLATSEKTNDSAESFVTTSQENGDTSFVADRCSSDISHQKNHNAIKNNFDANLKSGANRITPGVNNKSAAVNKTIDIKAQSTDTLGNLPITGQSDPLDKASTKQTQSIKFPMGNNKLESQISEVTHELVMYRSSSFVQNNDKGQEHKLKCRPKRKQNKSRYKKIHPISSLFEGEEVSCLVGRRVGYSKVEKCPPSDDNYVLHKLFAKSAVNTAFQHENILSGACHDDRNMMQRQAHKAAEESMERLRRSRKWCSRPTWNRT